MIKCPHCIDTGLHKLGGLPDKPSTYFCHCELGQIKLKKAAREAYPEHHPETALANYRAGREIWDTNGDMW